MSENLIYCYSGSGNCLDMAKNIAKELGDTEIVMMRSFPVKTDATEAKRVGFIFPCYGGGLPGNVESYVKAIHIGINSYKFAIVQYAGYKGCGLHKIPHHFGYTFEGKKVGEHCNVLTSHEDLEELTGNPVWRYTPCRVEAI